MRKNDWNVFHKPIVTTKSEMEKLGTSYILYDQITKLLSLTKEIIASDYSGTHKVMSVVGERGSGKTSLLNTYDNIISHDKEFYVFDIIDPNLFSGNLSILSLFVTNLYKVTEKYYEEMQNNVSFLSVIEELKRVIKLLMDIQNKDKDLSTDMPTIDYLVTLDKQMNFCEILGNLTNKVLDLLKTTNEWKDVKSFILIVDDIDLAKDEVVYQMIDEIEKYLKINVIVVLSYRESQIRNAISSSLLKEQKILIENKIIDKEDILKQSERKITKLIPTNNRIYLHSKQELLNLTYKTIDSNLRMNNIFWFPDLSLVNSSSLDDAYLNLTIEESIYTSIFYRTTLDITPVDKKENVGLFTPSSLRELIFLYEVIDSNMKLYVDDLSLQEKYLYNINYLKSYITYRIENDLPFKDQTFISQWLAADESVKLFIMYREYYNQLLYESIYDNEVTRGANADFLISEATSLKDAYVVEPHNISLGDLFEVFEYYKFYNAKSVFDFHKIYLTKVLISIELSISYLNYFIYNPQDGSFGGYSEEIEESLLNKYITLINGLILPENNDYYTLGNKNIKPHVVLGSFMSPRDEEALKELGENLIYKKYSFHSQVQDNIENAKDNLRFRSYYLTSSEEFSKLQNLRDSSKFSIDPFAFLGKKEYVSRVTDLYNSSDQTNLYIHTNIFVQDMLYRRLTTRRSQDNYIAQALVRFVNHLLTNPNELKENNVHIRVKSFQDEMDIGDRAEEFKSNYNETFVVKYKDYLYLNEGDSAKIRIKIQNVISNLNILKKWELHKVLKDLNLEIKSDEISNLVIMIEELKSVVTNEVKQTVRETLQNELDKLN